ncbi:hypothetical protein CEXT_30461 [Caerostris extrusa]|uniref:Uncharacterized protein n=1 Tax=Caerostris extrusa TaxID=172846 RepID=A0AAV4QMV1_CAEEX|nr:hypothetical protein CEXT_30461 [Caerostris extrusa]
MKLFRSTYLRELRNVIRLKKIKIKNKMKRNTLKERKKSRKHWDESGKERRGEKDDEGWRGGVDGGARPPLHPHLQDDDTSSHWSIKND